MTHPGADGWKLASRILAPLVDLLMHGGRQTAKDRHGESGDLRWAVAPDTQHLPISLQGSLVDGARIVGVRLHRVEETRPERKRFQIQQGTLPFSKPHYNNNYQSSSRQRPERKQFHVPIRYPAKLCEKVGKTVNSNIKNLG